MPVTAMASWKVATLASVGPQAPVAMVSEAGAELRPNESVATTLHT